MKSLICSIIEVSGCLWATYLASHGNSDVGYLIAIATVLFAYTDGKQGWSQ